LLPAGTSSRCRDCGAGAAAGGAGRLLLLLLLVYYLHFNDYDLVQIRNDEQAKANEDHE
jgi:hypothetical protein